MEKNLDRDKVTNPNGVPWRKEIVQATLSFRGQTYSGLFYQMLVWPQLEPTSEFVFESPKLKLYISAGKKAGATNCWIPESREYVRFDDFSIESNGSVLRWWEEWWGLPPKKDSDGLPPKKGGGGQKRHLRLV